MNSRRLIQLPHGGGRPAHGAGGRAAPSTSPGMVTHVSGAREGTILQESDRSLEISGCDWTGTDCELARNLCNHTTRLTPKTT